MEFDTRTESSRWCCTSEGSVPGCDVGCGILWDAKYHLHHYGSLPSYKIKYRLHAFPRNSLSLSPVPGHRYSVSTGQCQPPHAHTRPPHAQQPTPQQPHQSTKTTPLPLCPSRRRHANCQKFAAMGPRWSCLGGDEGSCCSCYPIASRIPSADPVL
jgi:hypothetical protein